MHRPADVPEVDPHEAAAAIENGAYHVDVREPDELSVKRIPGAHNLPLSRFLETYQATLPTDRQVVVSCRSGARSGRVTAFLREHDYDAVNLGGGILAWEEHGLPVEEG